MELIVEFWLISFADFVCGFVCGFCFVDFACVFLVDFCLWICLWISCGLLFVHSWVDFFWSFACGLSVDFLWTFVCGFCLGIRLRLLRIVCGFVCGFLVGFFSYRCPRQFR